MIEFFFNAAPNPLKVALFLEESGLDYRPVPVETKRGEQHTDTFRAMNPNGKVPAIVDDGAAMFDSNAILLHLAEKTGQFLGDPGQRPALLSWLFFVASGIGPYSGQAVHFRQFAVEKNTYAHRRYQYEAQRHWQIIEDRLEGRDFIMGTDYTIVDMAIWGWAPRIPFMLEPDAMDGFPNLADLMARLNTRPAAQAALALPKKYPFRTEMDDEAIHHMYPQIFA